MAGDCFARSPAAVYKLIQRPLCPARPSLQLGIIGGMPALRNLLIIFVLTLLAACTPGGLIPPSETPAPTETASPPTPTPVPMAALVNGEGIPLVFFNEELSRFKQAREALGSPVSDEEAASIVLEDMISNLLLAQGAAENGFAVTEELLIEREQALVSQIGSEAFAGWLVENGYSPESFRHFLRQSIAVAWMRDQIAEKIPQTAQQVHVRQILLYNEDAARTALARLQAGEEFETLAAFYDPLTRGDIGWFPREYLHWQAVEEAAFSLTPGATSEIIASEVGFHILKLIEAAERPLSPDALLALQEQAVRDWVSQRRQQSEVILAP